MPKIIKSSLQPNKPLPRPLYEALPKLPIDELFKILQLSLLPPNLPLFSIEIQYSLQVNKRKARDRVELCNSVLFSLKDVEDVVLAIINSLALTINRRSYC